MNEISLLIEKPEDKLMVYSAQTEMNRKFKKKIKALIEQDIDWDYLIASACRNWVISLMYFQINRVCPEIIPGKYSTILKDYFDWGVKYNLLLTAELFKILKLLNSQGIIAIPYNGPVLAYRIYKNFALREFNKLNIIIGVKDIQKSKEILISQGYEPKYNPNPNKETAFIKSVREYIFINKKNNIQINIKWDYLKDFFSSSNDLINNWNSRQMKSLSIDGFNILSPSIEDLLLILSMECAKNQWSRLIYICDLAELIRNNNLDWTKILDKSREFRLKRILFINLYLTENLYGIRIPEYISNLIRLDHSVKIISENLIKRLFTHDDSLIRMRRENRRNAILSFNIRENILDGVNDLFNTLIISNPYKTHNPSLSSPVKDCVIRPLQFLKENLLDVHPTIFAPEPYVQTPSKIIKKMLQMAGTNSRDIVYDLGCGDGRIVITAAKEYGTKGVGIDYDSQCIEESKNNAIKEGVEDKTIFLKEDILKTDISEATLVTMYHLPIINLAIRSKLQKELKPQTRIVTREFTMGEWEPAKTEIVSYDNVIVPIYLFET